LPDTAHRRRTAHPLRWTLCATALVGLAALISPTIAAAAPPNASFTYSPGGPVPGQSVLFLSTSTDPDGDAITAYQWNFGDGTVVAGTGAERHTYAAPGTYQVTLTVTANAESDSDTVPVVVRGTPQASILFSPTAPFIGQQVAFSAVAQPSAGQTINGVNWDLDGDGAFDDASGVNAAWAFGSAGTHAVAVEVTQPDGGRVEAHASVPVNALPSASFAFSPRTPEVGQQVEFVSSAVDPEGNLREQRWDLDGDGQFDDAQGDRVLETYTTPGEKSVRLRVEDAAGLAAVRERTVSVEPGPVARAGFLNPFPVVRIRGEVRGSGARVTLLSVRAPRRTVVRVRCIGKGCPRTKARRKRVGKTRRVRFRAFERQLPAGVRLEVFVRQEGKIGKFTSFRIRRGAAPRRTDRCLMPGLSDPVRCP
jgi:PKD repeat protein